MLVLGCSTWLLPLDKLLPPPAQWTAQSAATGPGRATDSKMLGRIRGLLAKAESTQFPAEAEALSAKAQDLMTRYAIDSALLDTGNPRNPYRRCRHSTHHGEQSVLQSQTSSAAQRMSRKRRQDTVEKEVLAGHRHRHARRSRSV
ncbi:DUF2786 domain-containing protein [Rhodococcus sp. SBT000017]|nr:DUF2786 domain-containing protein [Rhodococcus sp. SBT000017]